MWSKRAPILFMQCSLRGTRPRLWLFLPLALYVPQQLLLAWEGALALLPGQTGAWLRRAVDTVQRLLAELIAAPPQSIADVNVVDGSQHVRMLVRTWGFGNGGEAV